MLPAIFYLMPIYQALPMWAKVSDPGPGGLGDANIRYNAVSWFPISYCHLLSLFRSC
jgi:hypothetical protein